MTILIALLIAQAAPQHPCAADAQKLCPGVEPGEGRIAQCLKQHKDEVSAACKQKIATFREEAQACQADVQRLCPNAKPGKERQECMRQHKDEVSNECKQFVAGLIERHEETRQAMRACRGDAQKFCKGVQPGEGRIVACLKQHQSDLSQGCANALK